MRLQKIAGLAEFPPGYFALVMATGIISIASWLQGFSGLARGLFVFNLVAYAVIWGLQLARLAGYPRAMRADLASHERGAGFLTVVAATALIGSGFHLLWGADAVALGLWFFAIGLWVVLLYAWFASLIMVNPKPPLDRGINGGWFLLTVSTQSLAILGTFVADQLPSRETAIFVCLALYMLGAMFYLWVIGLVLLRWFFSSMESREAFSPAAWISSGAMAITTLAGARLIDSTSRHAESLSHFLTAFNLLFWATATWWIPLLCLVGAWRILVLRHRVRYEPEYWSMVFPLGMYSACTSAYADSASLSFLAPIAFGSLIISWVAWGLAAVGTVNAWRGEKGISADCGHERR